MKANLQWQGLDEQHPLVNYLRTRRGSLSNPTAEHFLPLLYVLGTWDGVEAMTIPVDGIEMGSLEHAVGVGWRLMIARSGGIYRRRSAALFDENVRIEARQIPG